jgi:hypothetical protein
MPVMRVAGFFLLPESNLLPEREGQLDDRRMNLYRVRAGGRIRFCGRKSVLRFGGFVVDASTVATFPTHERRLLAAKSDDQSLNIFFSVFREH